MLHHEMFGQTAETADVASANMPPKSFWRKNFSNDFQADREQRLAEVAACAIQAVADADVDSCPSSLRQFLGLEDLMKPRPSLTQVDEEQLFVSGRRFSVPGRGFKANIDGKWQDYTPSANKVMQEVYMAGVPSLRLHVAGHMYKFDFKKMQQTNLNTLEVCDIRAPGDLVRPQAPLLTMDNLTHPTTRGFQSVALKLQRPVYVVRVPEGGPGTTIHVPHPKKLGKALPVSIPNDAKVGEALYIKVPRMGLKKRYLAGGAAAGAGGGLACGVIASNSTCLGASAAGAAGLAAAGPVLAGGVAVAGAVAAGAAAVHYATRRPLQAAAIGAVALGGLAFADHVGEVGFAAAVGDLAEGAGDVVEATGDFVEGTGDVLDEGLDAGEDVTDEVFDVGEIVGDAADDGVDFITDLF